MGEGIVGEFGIDKYTVTFKMDNQGHAAQGTLVNVMWQPGWEEIWGENGYMYMYD